jgi:hypothetical protein
MRLLLPLVWSTLAVALRLDITARSVSEYKTISNNVLAATSDHESIVRYKFSVSAGLYVRTER